MAPRETKLNVVVELSPEDRKLLKSIAKALGVTDDESFADTTGQFGVDANRRRLVEDSIRSFQTVAPPAEGDWLLTNDEHEGEDLE